MWAQTLWLQSTGENPVNQIHLVHFLIYFSKAPAWTQTIMQFLCLQDLKASTLCKVACNRTWTLCAGVLHGLGAWHGGSQCSTLHSSKAESADGGGLPQSLTAQDAIQSENAMVLCLSHLQWPEFKKPAILLLCTCFPLQSPNHALVPLHDS